MKLLRNLLLLGTACFTPSLCAQEFQLSAGNTFFLRIAGVPAEDSQQISGIYTISTQGKVTLPYLTSDIASTGMTPTQLQHKIAAAYKDNNIFRHPTVVVLANGPGAGTIEFVVTVGGEVRQPGDVAIRPGLKLFSAISKCGGPTEYGNMKKVKLIRKDGVEKIYDMRKITAANNPEISAGDQVIISAN